jgi:chromosome segregation ATPase
MLIHQHLPGSKMKITLKVLLSCTLILPTLAWAQAGGCDAKRDSLEKEIAYAQAHGNPNRVQGLETALAKMKANCTDASLRSAHERKVAAAQGKLAQREHDLQEAKAQNKSAKKIAQRQKKVDEAHADLEKAQTEGVH